MSVEVHARSEDTVSYDKCVGCFVFGRAARQKMCLNYYLSSSSRIQNCNKLSPADGVFYAFPGPQRTSTLTFSGGLSKSQCELISEPPANLMLLDPTRPATVIAMRSKSL